MLDIGCFIRMMLLTSLVLPCQDESSQEIICIDQELENIPRIFSRTVRTVVLSENRIARLDGNVLQLYPDIEILKIDCNNIKASTDFKDISLLKKLRGFDVSNNQLMTLDFTVFNSNILLERIIADNNLRLEIAEFSVDLPNIIKVSLRNCTLINFPLTAFEGFLTLRSLDLRNNKLKTLPNKMLDVLPDLRELLVANNYILVSYMDPTLQIISDLRNMDFQGQEKNAVTVTSIDSITLMPDYSTGTPNIILASTTVEEPDTTEERNADGATTNKYNSIADIEISFKTGESADPSTIPKRPLEKPDPTDAACLPGVQIFRIVAVLVAVVIITVIMLVTYYCFQNLHVPAGRDELHSAEAMRMI